MPTLSDFASFVVKETLAQRAKKAAETNAMFDAQKSVDRNRDAAIVTPAYTRSALLQMGWQLSRGETKSYRAAFMTAFADAWTERYTSLTGQQVQP